MDFVMEKIRDFFTLRSSDLNTALTYVLKDNFCPCLLLHSHLIFSRKRFAYLWI